MNKDYRDHDYEDRRGREYWFYYDSEDEDWGNGGPKSVIPIVIYVLLAIITSFMGGGLPAAVFGLVPLYVYYKC